MAKQVINEKTYCIIYFSPFATELSNLFTYDHLKLKFFPFIKLLPAKNGRKDREKV